LIFNYFSQLDQEISRICETAGKNTRVFFISDHGFGPHLKWLYINTWLSQNGWLAFNPLQQFVARSMDKVRRILRRHAFVFRTMYALRRILRPNLSPEKVVYKFDLQAAILWERTKAFAVSWGEQGIRINLRGREPNGTVSPGREYEELRDAIITQLRELRDPDTGAQIIDSIWKREELYAGPYAESAADIVFSCEALEGVVDVFPHKHFLETTSYASRGFGNGCHRMDGMFVACGPGIKTQGKLKSAQLQDLLPTLLYSLRQPIPNDVDGRLLSEIYTQDLLAEYQPQSTEPIEADKLHRPGDYTEEEEKKVLERLRGLGYVE
jgi:predicted AlkP superfamily phosphohydrolase/phosphomutase